MMYCVLCLFVNFAIVYIIYMYSQLAGGELNLNV